MKRLILIAAALALSLPSVAAAEPRGHDKAGKHSEQQRGHEKFGARNVLAERVVERGNRGFERHAYMSSRNLGYRAAANGHRFKYKGRVYNAVGAPAFIYPAGWRYRHWVPGAFLPAVFIAEPYFIDYAWIGLPLPPPGHAWVRYGPDALLVNIFDGRIVDVAYDAFI